LLSKSLDSVTRFFSVIGATNGYGIAAGSFGAIVAVLLDQPDPDWTSVSAIAFFLSVLVSGIMSSYAYSKGTLKRNIDRHVEHVDALDISAEEKSRMQNVLINSEIEDHFRNQSAKPVTFKLTELIISEGIPILVIELKKSATFAKFLECEIRGKIDKETQKFHAQISSRIQKFVQNEVKEEINQIASKAVSVDLRKIIVTEVRRKLKEMENNKQADG